MARNTSTASATTYAQRLAETKEVKEVKLQARAVRNAARSVEGYLIQLSDRLENKQDDIESLKNSASFNIVEIVRLQTEINEINASIEAVSQVGSELFPA